MDLSRDAEQVTMDMDMSEAQAATMKKIYMFFFGFAIASSGLPGSSLAENYCGSAWWQKLGVPDYYCFGYAGPALAYAGCALGNLVGYKPVYFGAACKAHDDCYGQPGVRKEYCDRKFLAILRETCKDTLTGKYRKWARSECYKVADSFYTAVKAYGMKAYNNAQSKNAYNYTRNKRRSMEDTYINNYDKDINDIANDFLNGVRREQDNW